jgi:hypothetical protein
MHDNRSLNSSYFSRYVVKLTRLITCFESILSYWNSNYLTSSIPGTAVGCQQRPCSTWKRPTSYPVGSGNDGQGLKVTLFFKKKKRFIAIKLEYTLVQKLQNCSLNQFAGIVPRRASVKVPTSVGFYE